jgi:predicted DNA-binding transcriptional regulator AlpA
MIESNRHSRGRAIALRRRDDADQPDPATPDPEFGDPLLDAHGVRKYCGNVSLMTLWRWTELLGFPKPSFVIGRRRFWRLSSIETWLGTQGADASSDRAEAAPQRAAAPFPTTLKKGCIPDSSEANPAQRGSPL